MNLSREVIANINNNNSKIAKELVEIINEKKIKTLEELKEYENRIFSIHNKILTDEERIKYCMKIYESFPFEYEDLSFEELKKEKKLYNEIKTEKNIDEIKRKLIMLFSMTGREMFFFIEAYEMIINNNI